MSDPVELILEFLRRHRFAKAEAVFKAELLTREDEGRLFSPLENVSPRDLQLHSFCNIQKSDAVVGTAEDQNLRLPLERDSLRGSMGKELETLSKEASSPPEKQLYVEYEPGRTNCQDSSCTASEEFAFQKASTASKCETPCHLISEDHLCFPSQHLDHVVQGASWIPSSMQQEGDSASSYSRKNAGPLSSLRQVEAEKDSPAVASCSEATYEQQWLESTGSFSETQFPAQQQGYVPSVLQKDSDPHMLGLSCNTTAEGSRELSFQNEETAMGLYSHDQQAEDSINSIDQSGEISLQVHNVLATDPLYEGSLKDCSLRPLMSVSLPKSSENAEQPRSLNPEQDSWIKGKAAKKLVWDGENTELFKSAARSSGSPVIRSHLETLELDPTRVNQSGVLPRLPPVRLHFNDSKDVLKKDGLHVDDKNVRRNLELNDPKNEDHIMGEDTLGWGMMVDPSLGQDLPTSGSKRSIFRPSVSQGIVEAVSDQIPGFPDAADGWYPDEYCDSDAYEDDDDPGYHRQPIEDEEWFLAHEIDYPSDDERARQYADKHTVKNTTQSRKVDEDGRSYGEEEPYFSGEEYYRLQAAKKEYYTPQVSELRTVEDQPLASLNLQPSQADNHPLFVIGDENQDQEFHAEELLQMRPQPVWKGFIGHSHDLDENEADFDGYKSNAAGADGVDDDNHGSVRSGGILISSDIADVGSEVRDSLLGGSSEGDIESFKDQEVATYKPENGTFDPNSFHKIGREGPMDGGSASMNHLEEGNTEHDMVLQYYNEAWGLCKRATDKELSSRNTFGAKELSQSKHLTDCRNMGLVESGGSMFEGFSFPSPSSTGEVAVSTAGSGRSLRLNRESAAQVDEFDGYGSPMVGPDDTLAAWRQKSSNSSPIICSSEDNLQKFDLPTHSNGAFHSTHYYKCKDTNKHGTEEIELGCQLLTICQPSLQEEETFAAQEEMRSLNADDDQFEVFNLRIIHRKNRTGFEEDKDFPVHLNTVIAGRYHVTEYLGSAAFSKAIQAHDLHTGMDVCMKIIKNNKDFFDQSLDEIKLLKYVNKHDPLDKYHILRLYDYFYHREHLFIVCELLRANLYEFHKFNRESGGEVYFTMPRLQSITRQCLEALEFLHRLGIIHSDLKPENILVKSYSRCEIKIIDLGSSCFQTDHLCSYVQSRSYRAPEVILGLPYDQKIDIWSLGCILAELCTGNVLFQNDSLATLLARVVGILGPIDSEVLAKGRETHKYFTKNHMIYERNQETDQLEYLIPKKTTLSHRLPMGDHGFVEFVRYLLHSNPSKRPAAAEALEHPWLSFPYEPISS